MHSEKIKKSLVFGLSSLALSLWIWPANAHKEQGTPCPPADQIEVAALRGSGSLDVEGHAWSLTLKNEGLKKLSPHQELKSIKVKGTQARCRYAGSQTNKTEILATTDLPSQSGYILIKKNENVTSLKVKGPDAKNTLIVSK